VKADRHQVGRKFGCNLRQAREWSGLTQKELARRLAIHQGHLSQLENGQKCPRLVTVVTLARSLEVHVADLLDGIE
jgi:DNA-binding XRE family transcriptional regulator